MDFVFYRQCPWTPLGGLAGGLALFLGGKILSERYFLGVKGHPYVRYFLGSLLSNATGGEIHMRVLFNSVIKLQTSH